MDGILSHVTFEEQGLKPKKTLPPPGLKTRGFRDLKVLVVTELSIDDSGFAGITLAGARVELDLYKVNNEIVAIGDEVKRLFPDAAAASYQLEYLNRLCDYLVSLGFPKVSHFMADRFDDAIFEAAKNLGKTPASAPTPTL